MYRIGIDTGGTNTDVVLVNVDSGELFSTKTPTTPLDLLDGVAKGIDKITSIASTVPDLVEELIYGTTIVVNMIAQKKSEATALITTKGFKDVLEIGRASRDENIYDIQMEKPEPLISRSLRFEVTERVNFKGDVIEPLDEAEVRSLIMVMKELDIRAVAVCLLHSYANPLHEQRIKEIISEEWPDVYLSISSEINPQFREYERTSTAAINAFMQPTMASHLSTFEKMMGHSSSPPRLYIMQGNAGIVKFKSAIDKPVSVSDSGPIAGIIAANYLGSITGIPNIITLDMGGTSCEVSLIRNNTFQFSTARSVEGYPLNLPSVDLNFIGAGGGSIAWHDEGGALKVGPKSAGALPGPVCYQRGGTQPTVTDANLVTGRIQPEIFLEKLDDETVSLTRQFMKEKIAEPLHLDLTQAAEGILEVVNSNMIRAIKVISVERGHDPRDFTLIAFGGAGAIHAARLAEELEIPRVLIPYSPGTFSALGLILADIKYDYVQTRIQKQDQMDPGSLEEIYLNLELQGIGDLERENIPEEKRLFIRTCDMRYFGQAFELTVPIPDGSFSKKHIEEAVDRFHSQHQQVYGHCMKNDTVEFVNYRISAVGTMRKPNLLEKKKWETGFRHKEHFEAKIVFDGQEVVTPVLDRNSLEEGQYIDGPAIIGEMGSTIVVYPGQKANVDALKNVLIYTTFRNKK